MSPDIKAVPLLAMPATIAGAGGGRDQHAWAALLDSVRQRFAGLGQRELCGLLRESYYADLVCLVISTPCSASFLGRLREGLTEPVWEALQQDCQSAGDTLLEADQACVTYMRLDASLTQLVERRATADQLEQLAMFVQQLLALDEAGFGRCIEALGNMQILALMRHSGGIESGFSARVRDALSVKGWEFLAEDYPAESEEPILREDASAAIAGLGALMQGQPWPTTDASMEEDQSLIEALLTSLDQEK